MSENETIVERFKHNVMYQDQFTRGQSSGFAYGIEKTKKVAAGIVEEAIAVTEDEEMKELLEAIRVRILCLVVPY